MPKSHLERTLTGIAGEMFVAGKLATMGIVPMMTANVSSGFPRVDIFGYVPNVNKTVKIQVKTTSSRRKPSWLVYDPERLARMEDHFFVLVRLDGLGNVFYVLNGKELSAQLMNERTAYLKSHPTVKKPQWRISENYIKAYENKWNSISESII